MTLCRLGDHNVPEVEMADGFGCIDCREEEDANDKLSDTFEDDFDPGDPYEEDDMGGGWDR